MLLGFVIKELHDLHRVGELKNFATNILLKLVLVTYWDSCKGVSRVLGSADRIGKLHTGSRALKAEIFTTK